MNQVSSELKGRRDVVRGLPMFSRYSVSPVPDGRMPLVLLHGLVISSSFLRDAARLLGVDHPTYAPDLPGYGHSTKPPRTYGIEEQADLLGAWMDTVGIERAALAGSSMGTQFATALAAQRPELVERLVLLGPTMDPSARSRPVAMLRWLAESPHEIPMLPIAVRDYIKAGMSRARETFEIALADRMEDRLPQLDVPALVIRGEKDRIVSQEWAAEVARLLPQGRLEVVEGGFHALNFSSPERFAAIVRSFLAEASETAVEESPDPTPTSFADSVPQEVRAR
jgi:2-hydroxy-6-oxonona-2,4-dienedioate hydrolase